jgi:hypothetical protein
MGILQMYRNQYVSQPKSTKDLLLSNPLDQIMYPKSCNEYEIVEYNLMNSINDDDEFPFNLLKQMTELLKQNIGNKERKMEIVIEIQEIINEFVFSPDDLDQATLLDDESRNVLKMFLESKNPEHNQDQNNNFLL